MIHLNKAYESGKNYGEKKWGKSSERKGLMEIG